jgi:hypothetical protein
MEESNGMGLKMERESRERKFVTYGRIASCSEVGNLIGGCGRIVWLVKSDLCEDRLSSKGSGRNLGVWHPVVFSEYA